MFKKYSSLLTILVLLSCLFLAKWFVIDIHLEILVNIREAIHTHDNGPLLISSAIYSGLQAIVGAILFISCYLLTVSVSKKLKMLTPVILSLFLLGLLSIYHWYNVASDWPSQVLSAGIVLLCVVPDKTKNQHILRTFVLTIQVFFAIHWLNLIPIMSRFGFGQTDIPNSIRIVSSYFKNPIVLDFLGFAFFSVLFLSATLSVIVFRSFDKYLLITEQNYETEKFFRAKVLENRIYEEVHALTHDLKTPLVTIRGLSSLLPMCSDLETIATYADRIDGAAQKMSDMISSFLYDTSRQSVMLFELVDTLKAQLPLHDKDIEFTTLLPENDVQLTLNKIRMVRALINIVENAIMAPTRQSTKTIHLAITLNDAFLYFDIIDNGLGISPKDQAHIFEIGFSSKGTTGLGLAFAKKVIEDHQGQLTLIKSDHGGSHFQIALPYAVDPSITLEEFHEK